MYDLIHERGNNVSVYTNISDLWGWIIPFRGEEVIYKPKTSKILGFYVLRKWKKLSNGPPFGSYSREK